MYLEKRECYDVQLNNSEAGMKHIGHGLSGCFSLFPHQLVS